MHGLRHAALAVLARYTIPGPGTPGRCETQRGRSLLPVKAFAAPGPHLALSPRRGGLRHGRQTAGQGIAADMI